MISENKGGTSEQQSFAVPVEAKRVCGSGGQMRKVYVCGFGCWHSSFLQASRCKNAAAKAQRDAERAARMVAA